MRTFITLLVLTLPVTAFADLAEVAATDSQITFRFDPPPSGPISLRAAEIYEDDDTAARPAIWTGTVENATLSLPRFDGPADRLYRRFIATDADGRPLGRARYVTDLTGLTRVAGSLPQPTTPKGLQCIVDLDDAIALGVKHAAVNVSLSSLYDPTAASPIRRDVDGVPVAAREATFAHLDATIKRMTDAGIRVTLILLNHLPGGGSKSPLVYPGTAPDSPNRIGGFNLTDAESTRAFRGLIELLAERYSRPDSAHGLVSGYIVGNEVQSHYDWYNLGDAPPETVVREYAKAVRVADLAVRRFHPDARVFVSLDHNWTRRHRPRPTRSMTGRALLDMLRDGLAAEGDIPWAVAFHPYPENLGDPRTWDDKTATLSFDSPRITFKNLEVLTAYLRQPRMLVAGEPRRLILSEQGFHCPSTPDGETLQAAAYAYAFERVKRIDGIESFIYHRHVDHPGEGGLHLGLREVVPGTFDRPAKPRKIYDLFRTIDTPASDADTEFAKPITGVQSWNDLAPKPVPPS